MNNEVKYTLSWKPGIETVQFEGLNRFERDLTS